MKKRKMKADSVDQLFEIVKAVQQGQDPEEMLKRKQAESAPLADSPNLEESRTRQSDRRMEEDRTRQSDRRTEESRTRQPGRRTEEDRTRQSDRRSEENQIRMSDRNAGENLRPESPEMREIGDRIGNRLADVRKKSLSEEKDSEDQQGKDWDDSDEFVALLNEESQNSFDIHAWTEKLSGGIAAAASLFSVIKKQGGSQKPKQKKENKTEKKEALNQQIDAEEALKKPDHLEEYPDRFEKQDRESDSPDIYSEKTEDLDRQPEKQEHPETDSEASGNLDQQPDIPEAQVPGAQVQGAETSEQADAVPEKTEDEKTIDRLLDLPKEGAAESDLTQEPENADKEENAEEATIQGIDLEEDEIRARSEKAQEAAIRKKILEKDKKEKDVRNLFYEVQDKIAEKEIGKKEKIFLGAAVVFIVILVMLISNAVKIAGENKKKSEHVTADAGLTILVEKEPEQWCQSYTVTLKVRVKGSTVSRVLINDAAYEPDEEGMINVYAEDSLLQAVVETEKGSYQAQIEIPKIDTQLPAVYAERTQDQVTLTAADGRSGVHKIWYAVLKKEDYLTLPYYQEYTEPFAYEPGAMYYFYAEDQAGNRSMPVQTTMEEADSILLTEEKLSLFPEETRQLYAKAEPEGALLNNLTFESMNPSIVTVDATGLVTAVSEGETAIKVKADGLQEVLCTAEVSRERTVVISAIGDCTLGSDAYFNTNVNFQAYESMYGSAYFFQNVKEILEEDDATFANLEGVFTESSSRENKQYAFKGDPDYTQILLDGSVEVVTLANNHSSDYGEQSKLDTKKYLTEAGIDYCEGDTIVLKDLNGIKTAFIGIYVLYDGMEREAQVRATIEEAKAQGAQLVIVAFHWGSEKAAQPDEIQTALAHIAVDCGADLVVGHHPHVLQGIEKYNGAYIVYSLANFCFGGNTNPSDKDTMIFRQTFTIRDGVVADDDQIEIIPCSVSGASGYNDYQPTPVTGTEAERILNRIERIE